MIATAANHTQAKEPYNKIAAKKAVFLERLLYAKAVIANLIENIHQSCNPVHTLHE